MTTILFFGDSITWGAWDPEGGWATRLIGEIHNDVIELDLRRYKSAYNLGINGDTSTGLRSRLEREVQARAGDGEDLLVVVAIGINDAHLYHRGNDMREALARFEANLAAIDQLVAGRGGHLIYIGPTAVDEAARSGSGHVRDSYRNRDIRGIDETLARFCARLGRPSIRPFDFFRSHPELLMDGLHPGSEGHQALLGMVRAPILEALEQLTIGSMAKQVRTGSPGLDKT